MVTLKDKRCMRGFRAVLGACLTAVLWMAAVTGQNMAKAEAASRYVYDEAGLLTGDEAAALEEKLSDTSAEIGMDLGFVSTGDLEGKTTREFADDFYDNNGFGTDEEYSGALLLVDMENREFYITTCGNMIDYLTDRRIEETLDQVMDGLDDGFYQAAVNFADACAGYVEAGYEENAHRYDEETGKTTPLNAAKKTFPIKSTLLALAVAAVAGALHYGLVASQYRNYGEPKPYRYVGNSRVNFRKEEDRLVNKFVTRRHLPPPPPPNGGHSGGRPSGGSSAGRSTVHHSSGGRSHGGGGRRF